MKHILSLLTLILVFASSDSIACSCKPLSKINDEEISKAKDIFIGKVIKVVQIDEHNQKIIFQVTERLKPTNSSQLEVFNGVFGKCGLDVKPDEEWYIFTTEYTGKSWVTVCGRSALLSKYSFSAGDFSKKNFRKYVRQYNRAKYRAEKEIKYIKKSQL